jgi:hypothetical protein
MTPVQRLHWYNPVLDERTAFTKMSPEWRDAIDNETYGWGSERSGGPLVTPDAAHLPNLASSLCTDGLHRWAVDLDDGFLDAWEEGGALHIRANSGDLVQFTNGRLVASSTAGHFHLYADDAMSFDEYFDKLDHLVNIGLVQRAYVDASRSRGQTLLRLPWIRKFSANLEAVA